MLSSGCFVIDSEHFSKPVGWNVRVRDRDTDRFCQHFDFRDFDLEVSARNTVIRQEIPFWFWVLPIPNSNPDGTATLGVRIDIEPRVTDVTFDPWQTLYLATNVLRTAKRWSLGFDVATKQMRVDPAKIWQDQSPLGTNGVKAITITTNTSFLVEYGFPCNPDMPFELSIEGISVPGQSVPVSVVFKPTWNVRPHFALPY